MNKTQTTVLILVLLLSLVLIGLGPLLTILSINVLFGLNIAYNFSTWCAMFWLQMVTFGGLSMAIHNLKK